MAAKMMLSDKKPTVPAGMPNYDIAGNAQRSKTPQEIANEHGQANVGSTQQHMSNNTPAVQGDLISRNGVQTPIRQPAHEEQALEALRQQGNMNLAQQQQAAEAALLQSKYANDASNAVTQTANAGQKGKDDMALLQARLASDARLQKAANAQQTAMQGGLFGQQSSMQGAQYGQENSMFQQRVGANNAQQQAMWDRIQSLGGFDSAEGRAIGNAPGTSPEEQAGRDAAFAREKDKIGQMGRGAVNSLAGLMSERGTVGGGYEQQGMADVVGGAQGQLGDVAREQTIQDLNRGSQISDRNYAGGIAKRGQDIQYKQALLQLMNSGGQY